MNKEKLMELWSEDNLPEEVYEKFVTSWLNTESDRNQHILAFVLHRLEQKYPAIGHKLASELIDDPDAFYDGMAEIVEYISTITGY